MTEVTTATAKYIFLDIVNYTQDRTVEAQSFIINVLNVIVSNSLKAYSIHKDNLILLPTGDGICIALINIDNPYDIHMAITLNILSEIYKHNNKTSDTMRKFQIRVGLNENLDNLIIDINQNRNLAGAGINAAQRIMSIADGSQIIISQTVYEKLSQREKYWKKFKPFIVKVKHNLSIQVYQYVNEHDGLNISTPSITGDKSFLNDNAVSKMLSNLFK